MKKVNIPCSFTEPESKEKFSSTLFPVKLTLLHDGVNRNKSSISLETIKFAADTIKNKPILAYIVKNSDGEYDFAGHEIELVLDANVGIKTRYLETPVGIIPESTVIDFVTEGEKTYMTCTGYIYKEYGNETLDLLSSSDGKCVSVELNVNEFEEISEEIYDITDFEFSGVTILSDSVTPGMDENCKINLVYSLQEQGIDYSEFIEKASKDIAIFEQESSEPEQTVNESTEDVEGGSVEDESTEKKYTDHDFNKNHDEKSKEDFSIFTDIFEKEIGSFEELKSSVEEMKNLYESELQELREFKDKYDKAAKDEYAKDLISKFKLDYKEVSETVERFVNSEINKDEFETLLYVEVGKKAINQKHSKENFSSEKIDIFNGDDSTNKEKSLYGGILNNILGY